MINNSAPKYSKRSSFLLFITLTTFSVTLRAQNTPTISQPAQMVDALHTVFGKHPAARAVHAKGIILTAKFTPAPQAHQLTTAPHLQQKAVLVTLRFSDFTGIPNIPDTAGASNPRGMAVKFHLPDGSATDIVAHSFNGFPVATTDEFRALLLAIGSSGANARKPTNLDKFLGTHPIAKTFLMTQKPASVSYGTLSYYGVNTFKFTNKEGKSRYARYQFIPEAGEHFLTKEQLSASGPDYLSAEIRKRVALHPVKFKLYAQLAEAGDKIEDPSIAWPDSRKKVLLGTIEIYKAADNTPAEDKELSFIPNHLPHGISIADPMLEDRSKAYPISVKERQQ
ncbi:catalase family peroxidase [Pedobacter sp. UYP1]|uniref:catalase family peroxidase n=1 Tax=Pedobacter sp. UYP1 TaxID=1756396 RepID=UPI003391D0CF